MPKFPLKATSFSLSAAVMSLSCACPGRAATCAWTVIPTVALANDGSFAGIAASPGALWAVGAERSTSNLLNKTDPALAETWDGTGWKRVTTQSQAQAENRFAGAAVSRSGVLTVGSTLSTTIQNKPNNVLTERGSSAGFVFVPNQNVPHSAIDELNGIAAVAPGDAWAVGSFTSLQTSVLIEHWNGSAWSIVPSPPVHGTLFGVTALARKDVWAVGDADKNGFNEPLVEHWDGNRWTRVPAPNPGGPGGGATLNAVSGSSTNDIWAVGLVAPNDLRRASILIEHWNGTSWSIVRGATQGLREPYLSGVVALSPTDVWAVGASLLRSGTATLTEHWDGSTWRIVPSPNPGKYQNYLNAVTLLPRDGIWAAGASSDGTTAPNDVKPLTERFACR